MRYPLVCISLALHLRIILVVSADSFYENLNRNIVYFENENIIVCGDWHLILDTEKDCDNYLLVNNPKARRVVLTLVEEENFIDVWRLMNEDTRKYP